MLKVKHFFVSIRWFEFPFSSTAAASQSHSNFLIISKGSPMFIEKFSHFLSNASKILHLNIFKGVSHHYYFSPTSYTYKSTHGCSELDQSTCTRTSLLETERSFVLFIVQGVELMRIERREMKIFKPPFFFISLQTSRHRRQFMLE